MLPAHLRLFIFLDLVFEFNFLQSYNPHVWPSVVCCSKSQFKVRGKSKATWDSWKLSLRFSRRVLHCPFSMRANTLMKPNKSRMRPEAPTPAVLRAGQAWFKRLKSQSVTHKIKYVVRLFEYVRHKQILRAKHCENICNILRFMLDSNAVWSCCCQVFVWCLSGDSPISVMLV